MTKDESRLIRQIRNEYLAETNQVLSDREDAIFEYAIKASRAAFAEELVKKIQKDVLPSAYAKGTIIDIIRKEGGLE